MQRSSINWVEPDIPSRCHNEIMPGLLDLPMEIRLQIYEYLPEPGWKPRIEIARGFRGSSNTLRMNVMRINRQMYREIRDFYSQNLRWWFSIRIEIAEVDEFRDVLARALTALRVQQDIHLARSFTFDIFLVDRVHQWASFQTRTPDIHGLVQPAVHWKYILGHWLRWLANTDWSIIDLPQSLKTFTASQRWPVDIEGWDPSHQAPGQDFARFIERYAKWSNRRREARPPWRRPPGRTVG